MNRPPSGLSLAHLIRRSSGDTFPCRGKGTEVPNAPPANHGTGRPVPYD